MIQMVIGLVFVFLFLSFLFFVAWYVAIPIILILFVFGIVSRVWDKVKSVFKKKQPVEKLERAEAKKSSKKTHVIDVDYTEV